MKPLAELEQRLRRRAQSLKEQYGSGWRGDDWKDDELLLLQSVDALAAIKHQRDTCEASFVAAETRAVTAEATMQRVAGEMRNEVYAVATVDEVREWIHMLGGGQ